MRRCIILDVGWMLKGVVWMVMVRWWVGFGGELVCAGEREVQVLNYGCQVHRTK